MNGSADATDLPLILDCRNDYETNIGRFEGAEPLQTETFRDSWDALKNRLADVPKDAPIMTYCTGVSKECISPFLSAQQRSTHNSFHRVGNPLCESGRILDSRIGFSECVEIGRRNNCL